jgi:hypothetical protein
MHDKSDIDKIDENDIIICISNLLYLDKNNYNIRRNYLKQKKNKYQFLTT